MLKLESNIDLDATPDVKFEITSVELNGAAVDFDKDAAVMSVDAATKSDDYSELGSISRTLLVSSSSTYTTTRSYPERHLRVPQGNIHRYRSWRRRSCG